MTKVLDIPKVNAKNMTEKEFFYGHKACAGCGGSIAVRLALKYWASVPILLFQLVVCRQ